MPVSHSEHKTDILEWYKKLQPESVVDIGAGCGTYADLMRPHHKAAWLALEVWAPYVTKYELKKKYDAVVVSDVIFTDLKVLCEKPSLVIMGDCLEHLEVGKAIFVLNKIQSWTDNLFLSLPHGDCPQNSVDGNWYEAHLSTWDHQVLKDVLLINGGQIVEERKGDVLSAFWWSKT